MNIFIIILLTMSFNGLAQESVNYDSLINIDKHYNHLVNLHWWHDRRIIKHTKKLKDKDKLREDKKWTRADKTTLDLIKNYRAEIIEMAAKYDVMPEAIAGAILAEYSLNFDLIDAAQFKLRDDFGVESLIKTDKVVKLLTGKQMSYGLGQVKFEWEEVVTRVVSEVEPSYDFIFKKDLFDQVGSFRIISAILKNQQEAYLYQGLDISTSPGILVTLFNLGGAESRAKATVKEGRNPKPNYMGMFVILYRHKIEEMLYSNEL